MKKNPFLYLFVQYLDYLSIIRKKNNNERLKSMMFICLIPKFF